jgi:protease IV
MNTLARIAVLLAAAAGLVAPRPSRAQDLWSVPSPTRGVLIPGGEMAGDPDATSVELNPGQLGILDQASTALVANAWANGIAREGRGAGLFYATPISLLRGFYLGAGLQWLHPSVPGQPSDYGKLSLAGAVRVGRSLGVGLLWERRLGSRYAGLDGLGIGLGWRPLPRLAVGLVGRDLLRPRAEPGAAPLPREVDGEVAVRPFGTGRLEIAGGLRLQEGGDASSPNYTRFSPHGRLSVGLMRGLTLFAELDSPRVRLAVPDPAGTGRPLTAYRGLVGLSANLDRLVVSGAGLAQGQGDSEGAASPGSGPGASVMVQSFVNRKPPLIASRYVAKVKLGGLESDRSFMEMVVALRRLGDDPTVGALLLEIGGLSLGNGRLEELRQVLEGIGRVKPLFAWLASPSTGEYYLASACHVVAIHPAGDLFLGGLSSTVTFFKNALDQLGVAVELVRIAEYKGAMEPFVFSGQSQPVRDNRNAMLDDLFARIKSGITRARARNGVDQNRIASLFDRGLFSAAEAKDLGLVDELADERQMDKVIQRRLGRRISVRDADYGRRDIGRWRPRRVAVVLIDGAITDGRPQGIPSPIQGAVAWADPILDALSAARSDPSVGAVVLRVNSPGGSAFASDRIAREVARLREARKPVVVSMGDTAASGGYYVAAPGDIIYASPSVVTGSIGIYAFKLDVAALVGKVGITTETTIRGGRADLYSMYRPWRADEREAVNGRIRTHYQQFLKTVAGGRKQQGIDEKRADDLGRGRIYTGAQAKQLGLVDRLGGVAVALEEAARRGRVPLSAGGLPEMVLLPNAAVDPLETLLALRRLVQADGTQPGTDTTTVGSGDQTVTASLPAPPTTAADIATAAGVLAAPAAATFIARHGRAAARLLLPILLGDPTALQARMPYDLEIR